MDLGAPRWRMARRAALAVVGILATGEVMHAGPASFVSSKEVVVASARVGPQGAMLETGKGGTPVDGIRVEIPAGALKRETTVTLSYNTGKLSLPKGEGSSAFLRIDAEKVTDFSAALVIHVSYDPKLGKDRMLVGYAIDARGRLAPIDSGPLDRNLGKASFLTMTPLLFTWVYAPM